MERPGSRSLSPEGYCTTCGSSDSQSVAGSDSKSLAGSDGKSVGGTQTVGAVFASGSPNPSAEGKENSTKRKIEEEVSSPSSPKPSKRFKQDSSDVTRDETEMPEYG